MHASADISHDFRLIKNQTTRHNAKTSVNAVIGELEPTVATTSLPQQAQTLRKLEQQRLVCYYNAPSAESKLKQLRLSDVDAHLCTHINIGMAEVHNCSVLLNDELVHLLEVDVPLLRAQNPALKLLLWVGGGHAVDGFSTMVRNHNSRKLFIQSLKRVLRQYRIDGIDLDWEFPSAYNKERQHFSQLLYEIKQEYWRERRAYLLSVAVAAPEGIALYAYDVRELNIYADYVNIMTYDYHFYTSGTPFTGLNSPLYARSNERSLLGTFNVNYTVSWWLANGLAAQKLVVGLPTYGHSFTLVNPFNNRIGAPAAGIGNCGSKGFTTYSELCWFNAHNPFVTIFFDQQTCSPYLSSGTEWISFENEMSLECKAHYVKNRQLGGVMIYSLNADDFQNFCHSSSATTGSAVFPLTTAVKEVLWAN